MTGLKRFPEGLNRPRLYYGWWVVAAGSLIAGIGSVNVLGFTVFFLPLSKELGMSRAVTSLVHSLSRLEGGLLGPLSGWLIDRLGVRYVLAAGSVIGGLGLILLGTVVHDLWSIFVVYTLLIGVGFNLGFFPGVIAAVNTWFVRRRTVAMGIVNAVWGAIAFVVVPLLSFITLHSGWRMAAVVAGGMVMATAIPAVLVIRNTPESMGLLPDGRKQEPGPTPLRNPAAVQRESPPGAPAEFTVGQALKTPAFWLILAASNLRMIGFSAIVLHFVPLLVWKGSSQQAAANMVGLWSLLVIPFSLTTGLMGDLWNKRLLLSLGMLLGAAAYVMIVLVSGPAYLVLFVGLLAVFDNMGVLNWSLLGDYFGRRNFATLRGIVTGVGSVGNAASPVFAGWVWDKTGSYTLALIPYSVGFVLSALIFGLLLHPRMVPRARPSSGIARKMPT